VRLFLRLLVLLGLVAGVAGGFGLLSEAQKLSAYLEESFGPSEPAPIEVVEDQPPAAEHAPAGEGETGDAHAKAQDARPKAPAIPLVPLDEVYVNLVGDEDADHLLGIKLEIELFEDADRILIERGSAGVKNAVIEAAREQGLSSLVNTAGKLYFKETLVSRINAFLNAPAVRDVHFASFYVQ